MKKITLLLILVFISYTSIAQGPFLYQVEQNWLAECDTETPLTIEDFENSTAGGGTSCGAILSSDVATNCFPAGELESGFEITASAGGLTFYGPPGQVGANQTVPVVGVVGGQGEFTVVTFTENVTRVALNIFDPINNMENGIIRVFDTEDTLLETFPIELEAENFKFFGIHSSTLIGRIELEDPDDGDGLIFGNLRFGQCSVNDDPESAITLTVGDVFEDASITSNNIFSSDSQIVNSTLPLPGCASYNGADLWYSVVVPASGSITVETQFFDGSSFPDSGLALYTEDLTEVLDCDDDDGEGLFSLIELTDRTPGETILIRVWEFGGNAFGEFMISAYDFSPPPNDLIENAIDVDEIGFPYTDSNINFPDATTDIVTNSSGCNGDAVNSVWYKLTTTDSGTVSASLDGDPVNGFIVFYSAANENATLDTLTFENSGTNQCTDFNTETSIEAIANQTYYLLARSSDVTSVTIDSDATLSTEENTIDGFSFFPNPVQDVLNVQASQTIDKVTLYNIAGQKVLDQNIAATNSQLHLGNLTSGIYLMTVTSGENTSTYKVIKH